MLYALSVRTILAALAALALLSGCGAPPPTTAYFNRGVPESLIDVSSEVVNLRTGSASDLVVLGEWIDRDQPTRAELSCANGDRCEEAKKILELTGVPYTMGTLGDNSVTLIYERILARDCDPRYVDNRANYYNTNHPNFGCAIAANMVAHVTDKQEFIAPALADDPSARRGVDDIKRGYTPRPVTAPYTVEESLASKAKTGN